MERTIQCKMSDSICSMGMYVGGFHMMDTYKCKKIVHKNCFRISQADLPLSNKDSIFYIYIIYIYVLSYIYIYIFIKLLSSIKCEFWIKIFFLSFKSDQEWVDDDPIYTKFFSVPKWLKTKGNETCFGTWAGTL